MDKRTRARELSIQALCMLDVQGDTALTVTESFFRENSDDQAVLQMAREWTSKTWANLLHCDQLIKNAAAKWELSRLSMVDRSILRLASYQLYFCKDIPAKVVINEAIEIAKKFSGDQSPRFVNGVLDAILRSIKEVRP